MKSYREPLKILVQKEVLLGLDQEQNQFLLSNNNLVDSVWFT